MADAGFGVGCATGHEDDDALSGLQLCAGPGGLGIAEGGLNDVILLIGGAFSVGNNSCGENIRAEGTVKCTFDHSFDYWVVA